MALPCGVWAGALGKGDLSAPGTEPESVGRLGCLEECVDACGRPGWRAGGQAQVCENFDDDGGSLNGGEDGQGPRLNALESFSK